jgi:predicted DNA-binding transcriptional regulator YafY
VLAWDLLRGDIRFFRIDRIKALHPRPGQFRLRRADLFHHAGEAYARTM